MGSKVGFLELETYFPGEKLGEPMDGPQSNHNNQIWLSVFLALCTSLNWRRRLSPVLFTHCLLSLFVSTTHLLFADAVSLNTIPSTFCLSILDPQAGFSLREALMNLAIPGLAIPGMWVLMIFPALFSCLWFFQLILPLNACIVCTCESVCVCVHACIHDVCMWACVCLSIMWVWNGSFGEA